MTIRSKDDIQIIDIFDPLDLKVLDEAEMKMVKLIQSGTRKMIVNLEHVKAVHVAGIRVLLSINRNIKRLQGDLKVTGVSDFTYNSLRALELLNHFSIYSDVEEAIESYDLNEMADMEETHENVHVREKITA